MKSIITTTLFLVGFLCLSQTVLSQTVGQGAWMVGGSAGFASQKFKDADGSFTYLNLSPNLGYFFADDLAVGLSLDFNSVGFDGDSESTFSLGPYVRYYVTNPIFIQVGANLGLDEGAGTSFGARVGYSWFLNNGVAIEPALFFESYNDDNDNFDFSIFGLSIGIQAFAHHDHGMAH